ncbi:MAG: hypothetical protein IJC43_00580, partial [Clostridia bacterium]|nr:hypothetical protein [Clostridia bacterium]
VVFSDYAKVVENLPELVISRQPEDRVTVPTSNRSTTFTVAASGGKEPYTYQWQYRQNGGTWNSVNEQEKNWANDWNTDTLYVRLLDTLFDYDYDFRCIVTDAKKNTVISDAGRLREEAADPLVIVKQPQDVTAAVGETATYSVLVSGGRLPYTYTWQWDNAQGYGYGDMHQYTFNYIEGLGTATLKIKNLSDTALSYNGSLRCVITDASGNSITTNGAKLSRAEPLTITAQPQSVSCYVGETATFQVSVSGGTPAYTYKWRFATNSTKNSYADIASGSSSISGLWTPTLTVKTSKGHVTSGTRFICVITDSNGNHVQTVEAKLNVSNPPSLSADVSWGNVDYDRRPFYCTVSGGVAPYTYSWKNQNGKDLGSASSCWTKKDDGTTKVTCTVTDAAGQSVSASHAVYY